jgi:hypothetical protein
LFFSLMLGSRSRFVVDKSQNRISVSSLIF